jgi:hypothetical protein
MKKRLCTLPAQRAYMPSNAPVTQWFDELLRSLTLGTQRHALREDIAQWVEDQGIVEITADPGERLMAAWSIIERNQRASAAISDFSPVPEAPREDHSPAPPVVARGLKLILEGVYPDLLQEAISQIHQKGWVVPPLLLPLLLEQTQKYTGPNRLPFAYHHQISQRFLAAGGNRGAWLAARHPQWSQLLPEKDPSRAWRRSAGPRERAHALWHWRQRDPGVAREALSEQWAGQSPKAQEILLMGMAAGISPLDQPWLRQALEPRRKGVRRALAQLLLLSEEAGAQQDFRVLANNMLTTNGNWRTLIRAPEAQEILEKYGGADKNFTPPLFWLTTVPIGLWETLSDQPVKSLLREISEEQLKQVVARQIEHPDCVQKEALLRELVTRTSTRAISAASAILANQVDHSSFLNLIHELLSSVPEALREDRPLRHVLMSCNHQWSDRISRSVIHEITLPLRSRALSYEQQKLLAQDWRATASRLDPKVMPWLRSQLDHHTHRPDAFGKLASEVLQATHFRLNVFYRK